MIMFDIMSTIPTGFLGLVVGSCPWWFHPKHSHHRTLYSIGGCETETRLVQPKRDQRPPWTYRRWCWLGRSKSFEDSYFVIFKIAPTLSWKVLVDWPTWYKAFMIKLCQSPTWIDYCQPSSIQGLSQHVSYQTFPIYTVAKSECVRAIEHQSTTQMTV